MSTTIPTTLAAAPSVFEQCFRITVAQEGALSTDRQDPGNWTGGRVGNGTFVGTKYGISAASYPDQDIVNLTLAEAKVIYERDYFAKTHCNMVPPPIACLMFDAAVNNGPAHPVPWLQQALRVTIDGKFGPITNTALQTYNGKGKLLLIRFQAIRLRFMASLPGWAHNTGWADRILTVALAAEEISNG